MIVLYNALLGLALIAVLPLVALLLACSARARAGLAERLRPLDPCGRPSVWVHAASVGEVEAAAPLIERLLETDVAVVATTLTPTGRGRMRERFPGLRVRLAPLDLPGLVHLSLRRARVVVLVLIETELWPNLIWATAQGGGRVVIASARVSDRSFRRYRAVRGLFRPLLRRVWRVAAQGPLDQRRFRALGVPEERCLLGGDLKLDKSPAPAPDESLRGALGPGPLLVGGSTHAGEEEALLAAWLELRAGPAPALRLVLVPRHPDRADQVLDTARRFGASAGLRSKGAARADVVVVDTVGELGSIYPLADLVFCGGTLAPVGGHNMVEPVQAGRVLVHGPHTENQKVQEALLRPLGVLHRVERARDLPAALERLWRDRDRNAPALRAQEALNAHRGAADRALALVVEAHRAGAPAGEPSGG